MVKDVLHGHKGLMSNPGTLAFRNTRPYKTLLESCVVTDFCWKYLASLDCLLADGMSFHLFFYLDALMAMKLPLATNSCARR